VLILVRKKTAISKKVIKLQDANTPFTDKTLSIFLNNHPEIEVTIAEAIVISNL
jgi:hypothetical protein